MQNRLWAAVLGVSTLANASCVTVGKTFDTTRVAEVREGQSRADILRWFGEPARGNKLSLVDSPRGCVKRYLYAFADGDRSHVLWIDFDVNDRVCSTRYSGGPT
ncbi:MAG: hypothetical protein U0414_02660 [Polyangiaceae bacterium]